MTRLPGPLGALDLGEAPIRWLRTAARFPFLQPDGEEKPASVWFVLCRRRCWLVAATLEDQWMVGDIDVALEKGWTWDAIRVGAWSMPLRQGTRGEARDLLKKWRLFERDGTPVPWEPPPRRADRAPAARGSVDVPDWVAEHVPADADARWLLGLQTHRVHPSLGRDGQRQESPIWVVLSDRSAALAAQGATEVWVRELSSLRFESRTTGRDVWIADGWVIPGAVIDRRGPAAAALFEAGDRWEGAARAAIDAGELDRATALIAEAFTLDRLDGLWLWIGLLLLERDPAAAVGAVLHALPDDLHAAAMAWAHRRPSLRKATARLPAGLLRDCPAPDPPEGFPWPPEGPFEVFASAAVLGGRPDDGLALWPAGPRADMARAAIAEDPAEAWWSAAEGWRARNEPERAESCARRALEASPDPGYRYRLAAWREGDEALWTDALPAVPPGDLEQSPETWRALAALAEARGAVDAARAAYARAAALDEADRASLVRLAALWEPADPEEARAALETLAERSEALVEPEPTRWWVHTELARLADDPLPHLREALQGDFLAAEAWDRALSLSEGVAPEAVAWWEHVRAVLTGVPGGAPARPSPRLDAGDLDALHPGGVGWLEQARHSLDTTEPPPRSELTRGLERVRPGAWPVLSAALSSLSEALSIEPPDVYLFRGEGAWGLSAWPTEPPLILVGHHHLDPDHALAMEREALTFALAVELVHLAAGHPLLAFDGGLVGTSRSVYAAFGKYAGAAETVVDVVTLIPGIDQLAKIQTLLKLSRRVFTARALVDKTTGIASQGMHLMGWDGAETSAVGRGYAGAALQFRFQADRAALELTGDLRRAVDAILLGSPASAPHAETARRDGLLAVLGSLDPDTALRLAELIQYAAHR